MMCGSHSTIALSSAVAFLVFCGVADGATTLQLNSLDTDATLLSLTPASFACNISLTDVFFGGAVFELYKVQITSTTPLAVAALGHPVLNAAFDSASYSATFAQTNSSNAYMTFNIFGVKPQDSGTYFCGFLTIVDNVTHNFTSNVIRLSVYDTLPPNVTVVLSSPDVSAMYDGSIGATVFNATGRQTLTIDCTASGGPLQPLPYLSVAGTDVHIQPTTSQNVTGSNVTGLQRVFTISNIRYVVNVSAAVDCSAVHCAGHLTTLQTSELSSINLQIRTTSGPCNTGSKQPSTNHACSRKMSGFTMAIFLASTCLLAHLLGSI